MIDKSRRGKFLTTETDIENIKHDLSLGMTQNALAAKYGLKRPYISKVKLGTIRKYF